MCNIQFICCTLYTHSYDDATAGVYHRMLCFKVMDNGCQSHIFFLSCTCFLLWFQEQLYTGSDISSLLVEIQKAQDVINKIKEMRQGLLGTALVSVMNEVNII